MTFVIKYVLLCMLFIHSLYPRTVLQSYVDPYESLIAIVIMVKNEADVIIPTLDPLLNAGIDCVLVYDTGSTDGTQTVVNTYFKDHHLDHAYVIEDPFIDFATSRNRALDIAETLFPHVTFFVMLDAEWYIHNAQELVEFCHQHKNYIEQGTTGGCYSIRLVTQQDNIDNYTSRLIRREKNARYEGVVHESIQQRSSGFLPRSVFFEYAPKEHGQQKSKNRFIRDYELLKKSIENNPHNPRTFFYLAQTCQFLDKWEEAITYYQKRAHFGDISEECYLALYRIGCALEYLYVHKNDDLQYKWEDALYYYLKAHAMLPHRAEPLVRIANYYNYVKEYPVAYLFASRAALLPYPSDVLFVEKQVYDYMRYDVLGQCALYVGEYEIGKDAILKAMKVNPSAQHLYHNLAIYLQNMAIA